MASSGEASERATQKRPRESWILFIATGVFARPFQPSSLFPSLSPPSAAREPLSSPPSTSSLRNKLTKGEEIGTKKPEPKNKNKQPPPVPARGPARPRPRCAEGRGLRLGPRRRRARRCQARAGPRGRGQVVRGGFGGGEAALPRGDDRRRRRRGRRRWWRFERRSAFELSRRRRDPDSRGGVLRSHAGDGEWRTSGLPQEVVLGRS